MKSKIVMNPTILVGKPTIAGTRISVDLILSLLSSEVSFDEIIEDYPHLTKEDIKTCLKFAQRIIEKTHPAVKK